MKKLKISICILFLFNCATSYQKKSLTGGYEDFHLDSNIYKISFEGNGYTKESEVYNMFLRRCAEVTIENNFEFFDIIEQNSNANTSYYTSSNGNINQVNSNSYQYSHQTNTTKIKKHSTTGIIKLLKASERNEKSFNARVILNNLVGSRI